MKKVLTIVALSFAVILTGNSQGIKNDTLDQKAVIITSSKLPEQLRESSKNVEVISQEIIAQSQGKDLAQILTEHAGINVNGALSNPAKDRSLYMRGAGNGYTLILLNGIPLTDPSGVSNPLDLRLVPSADIERIEILKGNQSTLYGSNAIAGVINIITKNEVDNLDLQASQSVGSFKTLKSTFNVKVPTSFATFSQSGQWEKSEGISDAFDKDGTGTFDKDGMENIQYQSSIAFTPMANLSLTPFFRYSSFKGDYDDDAFFDGANTYTSESSVFGLDGIYSNNTVAVRLNFQRTLPERTYSSSFGDNFYKGSTDHLELFGRGSVGGIGKLMGGIAYQSFKVEGLDNKISTLLSPYLSMYVSQGSFAGDIGVRYNKHNEFGNTFTYSINPTYRIVDGLKIFTSYGTGFKAPTMSELYGIWGANPDLQPEKSRSFEVGIIGKIVEEKLSFALTYFDRKIKDIITYNFINGYTNSDLQKDYGLEVSMNYEALPSLTIGMQYEYLQGEITPGDTSIDPFFNLYRRPKHRIATDFSYTQDRWLVTARINFTDQRTDVYFNPANFWAPEEVSLNSFFYGQLYGQFSLAEGKVSIYADIKNLMNADFQEVYGYNTPGINAKAGILIRVKD